MYVTEWASSATQYLFAVDNQCNIYRIQLPIAAGPYPHRRISSATASPGTCETVTFTNTSVISSSVSGSSNTVFLVPLLPNFTTSVGQHQSPGNFLFTSAIVANNYVFFSSAGSSGRTVVYPITSTTIGANAGATNFKALGYTVTLVRHCNAASAFASAGTHPGSSFLLFVQQDPVVKRYAYLGAATSQIYRFDMQNSASWTGTAAYQTISASPTSSLTTSVTDIFSTSMFFGDNNINPPRVFQVDYQSTFTAGTVLPTVSLSLSGSGILTTSIFDSVRRYGYFAIGGSSGTPAIYKIGFVGIASFSPMTAPETGGTMVTVYGFGFSSSYSSTLCSFGNTTTTATIISTTAMRCASPVHSPSTVAFSIIMGNEPYVGNSTFNIFTFTVNSSSPIITPAAVASVPTAASTLSCVPTLLLRNEIAMCTITSLNSSTSPINSTSSDFSVSSSPSGSTTSLITLDVGFTFVFNATMPSISSNTNIIIAAIVRPSLQNITNSPVALSPRLPGVETTLSCSSEWVSPSDQVQCVLTCFDSYGPVLGLVSDFSLSASSGSGSSLTTLSSSDGGYSFNFNMSAPTNQPSATLSTIIATSGSPSYGLPVNGSSFILQVISPPSAVSNSSTLFCSPSLLLRNQSTACTITSFDNSSFPINASSSDFYISVDPSNSLPFSLITADGGYTFTFNITMPALVPGLQLVTVTTTSLQNITNSPFELSPRLPGVESVVSCNSQSILPNDQVQCTLSCFDSYGPVVGLASDFLFAIAPNSSGASLTPLSTADGGYIFSFNMSAPTTVSNATLFASIDILSSLSYGSFINGSSFTLQALSTPVSPVTASNASTITCFPLHLLRNQSAICTITSLDSSGAPVNSSASDFSVSSSDAFLTSLVSSDNGFTFTFNATMAAAAASNTSIITSIGNQSLANSPLWLTPRVPGIESNVVCSSSSVLRGDQIQCILTCFDTYGPVLGLANDFSFSASDGSTLTSLMSIDNGYTFTFIMSAPTSRLNSTLAASLSVNGQSINGSSLVLQVRVPGPNSILFCQKNRIRLGDSMSCQLDCFDVQGPVRCLTEDVSAQTQLPSAYTSSPQVLTGSLMSLGFVYAAPSTSGLFDSIDIRFNQSPFNGISLVAGTNASVLLINPLIITPSIGTEGTNLTIIAPKPLEATSQCVFHYGTNVALNTTTPVIDAGPSATSLSSRYSCITPNLDGLIAVYGRDLNVSIFLSNGLESFSATSFTSTIIPMVTPLQPVAEAQSAQLFWILFASLTVTFIVCVLCGIRVYYWLTKRRRAKDGRSELTIELASKYRTSSELLASTPSIAPFSPRTPIAQEDEHHHHHHRRWMHENQATPAGEKHCPAHPLSLKQEDSWYGAEPSFQQSNVAEEPSPAPLLDLPSLTGSLYQPRLPPLHHRISPLPINKSASLFPLPSLPSMVSSSSSFNAGSCSSKPVSEPEIHEVFSRPISDSFEGSLRVEFWNDGHQLSRSQHQHPHHGHRKEGEVEDGLDDAFGSQEFELNSMSRNRHERASTLFSASPYSGRPAPLFAYGASPYKEPASFPLGQVRHNPTVVRPHQPLYSITSNYAAPTVSFENAHPEFKQNRDSPVPSGEEALPDVRGRAKLKDPKANFRPWH